MYSYYISVLRYFLTAKSTSQVSVVRSQRDVLLREIKNNWKAAENKTDACHLPGKT